MEQKIYNRRFRLLDEFEASEKGKDPYLSFGLVDAEDSTFTEWRALIIGPVGTVYAEKFYTLRVTCGKKYPYNPPMVRFVTKINLPYVNQENGLVYANKLDILKKWDPETTIELILKDIKKSMSKYKKLKQPPEGEY